MGFSRQADWSGLPSPPQGLFPAQGLNLVSRVSYIGRRIFYHWAAWEAHGPWHRVVIRRTVSPLGISRLRGPRRQGRGGLSQVLVAKTSQRLFSKGKLDSLCSGCFCSCTWVPPKGHSGKFHGRTKDGHLSCSEDLKDCGSSWRADKLWLILTEHLPVSPRF